MTIGCNIWMICLKLNWFFYGLSRMLQFSQFAWTQCYSVWDNFLLIDATDRSKINSNQKRFFIALSLYPLSFFANTPLKGTMNVILSDILLMSGKFSLKIIIRGFSTNVTIGFLLQKQWRISSKVVLDKGFLVPFWIGHFFCIKCHLKSQRNLFFSRFNH